MKSCIDNSVNLGGDQTVTGSKTYTAEQFFEATNIDNTVAPAETTQSNPIKIVDKYGNNCANLIVRKLASGGLEAIMRAYTSGNNSKDVSVVAMPNGTGYRPFQRLQPNSASGLNSSLNSNFPQTYTMPFDGIFVCGVKVGGQPISQVTLSTTNLLITRWQGYGGSTEYDVTPFSITGYRGQVFTFEWNGSGLAGVDFVRAIPYQS